MILNDNVWAMPIPCTACKRDKHQYRFAEVEVDNGWTHLCLDHYGRRFWPAKAYAMAGSEVVKWPSL